MDELAAELVTAAVDLGEPVTLGVMALDPASVKDTNILGVDRVVGFCLPVDQPSHEVQQRVVEALIEQVNPRAVLMSFSWETAAFAAGLAEGHDFSFASDVIELSCNAEGAIIATRPAYGGKVKARFRLPAGHPSLLLLRPGSWAAASKTNQSVEMEISHIVVNDASRVRLSK